MTPVDLRSDTVTRPSAAMREAMAAADVGDDVLDGDPTLDALARRVADLLGVEAALWTPTGCMANAIALMDHLERGDRFLAPAGAHVLEAELGTSAWLAGGLPAPLPHSAGPGRPTPADVTAAARHGGPVLRAAHPAAVPGEHPQLGGRRRHPGRPSTGRSSPRPATPASRCTSTARGCGTPRWRWACRRPTLAAGVDTVSVCLSKGLGAPMGSVVAGSAAFVDAGVAPAQDARRRDPAGRGAGRGGSGRARRDRRPRRRPRARPPARRRAAGAWLAGVAARDEHRAGARRPTRPPSSRASPTVGVRAVPFGPGVRFVTHRDVSRARRRGGAGAVDSPAGPALTRSPTASGANAPSRSRASRTSSVAPANESRIQVWPSTGSKSIPGATATPVSASMRFPKASVSSVWWRDVGVDVERAVGGGEPGQPDPRQPVEQQRRG